MPDALSTAITALALGVCAGALRMAWEIVVVGRRVHPETPSVLRSLAQRNRTEFVRRGREASVREIAEHVQQADPAMPEDRVDLDFEFHNRAN